MVLISRQRRRVTESIGREPRGRSAVGTVVGHSRADHCCVGREFLAHAASDVANAVLAVAAGDNFKRLLAWLAFFARLFARRPRTRRQLEKSARRRLGRVLHGRLRSIGFVPRLVAKPRERPRHPFNPRCSARSQITAGLGMVPGAWLQHRCAVEIWVNRRRRRHESARGGRRVHAKCSRRRAWLAAPGIARVTRGSRVDPGVFAQDRPR